MFVFCKCHSRHVISIITNKDNKGSGVSTATTSATTTTTTTDDDDDDDAPKSEKGASPRLQTYNVVNPSPQDTSLPAKRGGGGGGGVGDAAAAVVIKKQSNDFTVPAEMANQYKSGSCFAHASARVINQALRKLGGFKDATEERLHFELPQNV